MFDEKLDELQRHLGEFQQLLQRPVGFVPAPASQSKPAVLASLQRSLEDLQLLVADAADDACTEPAPPSRPEDFDAQCASHESPLSTPALMKRGPVLVRIMGADERCRWANRAWLEYTGRAADATFTEHWHDDVHVDDRKAYSSTCSGAHATGRLYWAEYRLQRRRGEFGRVLEIGAPRIGFHGAIDGYLVAAIEITEPKHAELHLALQYEIGRALAEALTLEAAAAVILRRLCEVLEWDLGELWSVEALANEPRCTGLWSSPSIGAVEPFGCSTARPFPAGAGPPWQRGEPLWIEDIATDAALSNEPEVVHAGAHGMFRLPLMVHGEVRGILRLFSRCVRPRDDSVVEFMTSVGAQIGQFLEHQRTITKIRDSEARKNAILDASLDAVITIDAQSRVVEFNSAAETIFGYRREHAVGREVWGLIFPPRMQEQALANFAHFLATGEPGLFGRRFDTLAKRASGAEFPVEVAMAPIGIGNPPLLTIFVCDATTRRQAEQDVKRYQERLRSLMANMLITEEQERRNLAIDLHDGLSQTIALMRIKLSTVRGRVDARLAPSIDEIVELVDQANSAARSIGFELSPPVLHDLGLEPAVQWLVENIHSRYGIEVVLEDDGKPKPADEKTRVILFRSIRELLINAAKHARARSVHVRLQREEDQFDASIEDDGVGMEVAVAGARGSGLISIQERLNHVGGSMQIESAPGRGTRVRLRAPLATREPAMPKVEA